MLMDQDQHGAANGPSTPGRGTGRRRRGAVLGLCLLVAALGAALLGGTLRLGASGATGPRIAAEVPVTAMETLRMPSNNSPAVVADPTDSQVVAMANRIDAPAFGCALQVSGDGGRTWTSAAPVPNLPPGADTCYAPEVAFDADGVLHYLFVGLQGRGNEPMGAFLTTSRDEGRTFGEPRQVLRPLSFGVRMAIDTTMGPLGRMHLVWLRVSSDPPIGGFPAEPNPILTAHSDDGGLTFSEPVQVSDQARARVVAPVLTLGPDRAVHVGYYDLQGDARDYQGLAGPVWDGTWSVVVATSVDGGRQFGAGIVVDDQIVPPDRPILIFTMAPPALVADKDRTCAAWTDARNGDADVLLRCSTDRGATWGEARRVNDDRPGNGIRQYLPRLGLAPGGRLDAAFLDRRHHPNNDRIDVSYTSSSDGGASFAPNLRLTREHSSALIGAEYEGPSAEGQHEIGGRLGLLSRRSGALVAWPDSRNSLLPGTGQDIYAADVSHGRSPQPGWARGLGVGLLGTGLLALALVALRRPQGDPERAEVEVSAPEGAEAGPEPVERQSARRRMPWLLLVTLPAVIAVGTVVALASGEGPALPGPQMVDVTMREYRFDYKPPTHAGRVVFHVRNDGTEEHSAAMYLLPDDMPPIDVQLRGEERRNVDQFAVPLPLRPGQSQSFAVDLAAGQRYAFLCFLRKDQKIHAQIGMNSELRTGP